jgi:hypothetical protein
MGAVEHGASLTSMLERRQAGPFARLELKRWILEDPASPGEHRPLYALERWDRVRAVIIETLDIRSNS